MQANCQSLPRPRLRCSPHSPAMLGVVRRWDLTSCPLERQSPLETVVQGTGLHETSLAPWQLCGGRACLQSLRAQEQDGSAQCQWVGLGGVGAVAAHIWGWTCLSSPGPDPPAFFPKTSYSWCGLCFWYLRNSCFTVALFLAKIDQLPRDEKCTKPCNLVTLVTSVRNYRHKTTIFSLISFMAIHIYVYLAKVWFIAVVAILPNIILRDNSSHF